jgi:broad specificity phosphatase PhoE
VTQHAGNVPLSVDDVSATTTAPRLLVLVRHARAERLARGALEPERPLTAIGVTQAARVAARLRAELVERPIRLYTSDYLRCRQTAAPIAAAFGVEALADARLRERHRGDAHHLTPEELLARFPETVLPPTWDDPRAPGAETWRQVHRRCASFLQDLPWDRAIAVVVAHGASIDGLVTAWLQLELVGVAPYAFAPALASLSVLRADKYGVRSLERLSDSAHLAGMDGAIDLGALVG